MRKTLIFITLLLLSNLIKAQSGEWHFLYGEKISSKWGQKPPYYLPAIDVGFAVNEIQSLNLGSSSIIYSQSLNSIFDWSLGIHYNRKGFKEIGIVNDMGNEYPFSQKKVFNFVGILAGFRYNFLKKNTWKLGIETLVNPEMEVQGYGDLKKITLSSMNMFYVEKAINRHLAVVMNPFFETSLMDYNNKTLRGYDPVVYKPYGYGLMIGLRYSK